MKKSSSQNHVTLFIWDRKPKIISSIIKQWINPKIIKMRQIISEAQQSFQDHSKHMN